MISNYKAPKIAILLLVLSFCVTGRGVAQEAPALNRHSMKEQMMTLTDWSTEVISLLADRFTLLPSGFWVSGATFGEHLYGASFSDYPQGVDVQSALGMQSTRAAFYDQIELLPLRKPYTITIEDDLRFFLLSRELHYRIESFAEVIVSAAPQGSLVKIALQQVESMEMEETSPEDFDRFVLANALAAHWRGLTREALERINWLIESDNPGVAHETLVIAKARILFEQGDVSGAGVTVLHFLDHSDAVFFQTFSHEDVLFIFRIFKAMNLPELVIDLAALAMVLYPEQQAYEAMFQDLVRLQEEVHP